MYGGLRNRWVGYKPLKFGRSTNRMTKYTAFYNLGKGINTFLPSHSISNDELSDAYNVEYSSWGLKTRAGKSKYNATEISGASSIRGLHVSYATGSRFILVADDQGKVYKDNGSGTLTELGTGYTADTHYHFHDWLTYTYWCNGSGSLIRYDGSNLETITQAPDDLIGVVNAENRLFGWTGTDNNLYFCDLRDDSDWDETTEYAGFLVTPQVKGDYIKACVKQGRSVIVFKDKSIWRYYLTGLPRNWQRELVSESLGIAGRFAVDVIEDVIFFMGDDGRVYTLTDKVKLVSNNIDCPDTSRWGLPTDVNKNKLSETLVKYMPSKKAVRVIYNDISSTTDYPNMYADYYLSRDAWLRGNLSAYNMAIADGADDTGYMYVGDPTSGYVYRIDNDTIDDSAAIDNYIITKDFNFGFPDIKKIFNTAYMAFYPSGSWNVILTEYVDFDPTGTSHNVSQSAGGAEWDTAVWDTDTWGGGGLVKSRVDLGNNAGYHVSYKLRNATADQYWQVRGIGFKYQINALI